MTTAICGMPRGRHPRLVEEDAAEVIAVGEDLGLQRQERAAGVHQVDARQAVLERDLLRAQVLLDGDRVVGAALHRGVVGHDQHFATRDPADAGDQSRAGSLVVVHVPGGQRRELEKGRARVEQPVDAFPDRQLALFAVALEVAFSAAALCARRQLRSKLGNERSPFGSRLARNSASSGSIWRVRTSIRDCVAIIGAARQAMARRRARSMSTAVSDLLVSRPTCVLIEDGAVLV